MLGTDIFLFFLQYFLPIQEKITIFWIYVFCKFPIYGCVLNFVLLQTINKEYNYVLTIHTDQIFVIPFPFTQSAAVIPCCKSYIDKFLYLKKQNKMYLWDTNAQRGTFTIYMYMLLQSSRKLTLRKTFTIHMHCMCYYKAYTLLQSNHKLTLRKTLLKTMMEQEKMLNTFSNNKFYTLPTWKSMQTTISNLMKMAESLLNRYKQFLLFQQCFQETSIEDT